MSAFSRRDVCQSLPLLALFPALAAESQTAATPAPKNCVEPVLSKCEAFPWEGLPVRYSDEGAPTRQILEGQIPGISIIELHETSLAPGKMPHPPHRHPHAELLMVRQGTIEFQSDAAPVKVTAGGAAYCAPNQLHGFKNAGDVEATYFVLKIGSEPVCQK
jgi:mannose-6-phosphate isomerase-like protein (cupin superfamily)